MRFSNYLIALSVLGAAACGPTYVVQGPPPGPAPQRAPEPTRAPPMEVSIVRTDEGRVLLQTSRQAYVAVFEIVPGRGVSLVYPAPMRPRNVQSGGLTWVNVNWTMRPDYRYASSETRYIYAVASDTPLRLDDDDYDARNLQRSLGSAYWSSAPNATVRAIAREFVRQQPDEWWGEDMTSMTLTNNRVNVVIRLARVYCPDGNFFEVRDDLIDRVWCPARRGGPRLGERPGASFPDSVFNSTGRRVPRHIDPSARTPIFRVPAGTDVGQQQGEPRNQPQNYPPRNVPPRNDPPRMPGGNNPPPQNQPPSNQPPANQPPATQPPATQPPATQPPANQPPATQPPATQPPVTQPPQDQPPQNPPSTQDPNGKDHSNNGRRAHGDPQNADPRGNGNGYGNGGRNTPSTQAPTTSAPPTSTPAQSAPQAPSQSGNNGQGQQHGNGNGNGNANGNNGNQNPSNNNNGHGNGKSANDAKPDRVDAPKTGVAALLSKHAPKPKQDKKAPADTTSKKP